MKFIRNKKTIHLTDYSSGRTLCGKIPNYAGAWEKIAGDFKISCQRCKKRSNPFNV